MLTLVGCHLVCGVLNAVNLVWVGAVVGGSSSSLWSDECCQLGLKIKGLVLIYDIIHI